MTLAKYSVSICTSDCPSSIAPLSLSVKVHVGITCQYISVHVSISQYMSVYLSTRQYISVRVSISQYMSVYLNTCQYISVHVSISQYTSVYLSTRQYISIHVSISQYTSVYLSLSVEVHVGTSYTFCPSCVQTLATHRLTPNYICHLDVGGTPLNVHTWVCGTGTDN